MARTIENYRDLQDNVATWLNRTDLVDNIPTFIYLAERKIFRRYRAPNNEKTITYDMRETPDGGDPLQLPLSNTIEYPSDYLESLTFLANGQPIRRVSITEMQARINTSQNNNLQAEVSVFARIRRNLVIWPTPQADTLLELIYYCDLSGLLEDDDDDHDILRSAPDLYLYGALQQAQPFLKPESDEWNLIAVWEKMYEEAFASIEVMRDDDEFSGSVTTVQSSFSGGSAVRGQSSEGF